MRYKGILLGFGSLAAAVLLVIGYLSVEQPDRAAAQGGDTDPVAPAEPIRPENAECLQSLRDLYRIFNRLPGSDSALYLEYTINVGMKDTVHFQDTTTADVSLVLGRNQLRLVSPHFRMMQDSTAMFTVIPETRTIYLGDQFGRRSLDFRKQYLAWAMDTILTGSRVRECRSFRDDRGNMLRRIVLETNPRTEIALNIRAMTYTIDETAGRILSVGLQPGENDRGMAWMNVIFRRTEYSAVPPDFLHPVSEQVLAENSRLLPKYTGYTLVDNRHIEE